MAQFVRHERCPKCSERGADRRGNNLGVYADGSLHCFSCGYHRMPSFRDTQLKSLIKEEQHDNKKTLLPSDFSREIPSAAWGWLLQYGLPYSYWQTHCGYSEKDKRLILTIGSPPRFAIGRAIGWIKSMGTSKWKVYGDKSSYVEVVGEQLSKEIVLVEDLISAHKVAASGFTCIPLFGTSIHDGVVKKLQQLKRPVVLWLDADQYGLLGRKIGRLTALTGASVRHIRTNKDPKDYSLEEIKAILT
jgi:hypothetical protein